VLLAVTYMASNAQDYVPSFTAQHQFDTQYGQVESKYAFENYKGSHKKWQKNFHKELSDLLGVTALQERYKEFVLEDGFALKLSDSVLLDYIEGRVSTEDMREHIKVEEQKWIRKAKKFLLYDDQPYRIK
jgi:hypothetical protein